MIKQREHEALEAYTRLLRQKGLSESNIQRRRLSLERLFPYLEDRQCNGHIYREAVDIVLTQTTDEDWPYFLAIIRDYYNFWMKDFKAIASLNKTVSFDIERFLFKPQTGNLHSLWARLDEEKFTMVETWPVKAYTMALRQEGADKSLVETRIKLVKLLLFRLRDATELDNNHYRIAVDSTLPLFKAKQTRTLFLAVVREFYYFWIGDPDAVSYIQIDKLSLAM